VSEQTKGCVSQTKIRGQRVLTEEETYQIGYVDQMHQPGHTQQIL